MNNRLSILDVFRFFSALSVMLYHYFFLYDHSSFSNLNTDSFLKYGYFGVEFFFVISGFVISMSAENQGFKKFLVSRIARIMPALWVCVTLTSLFILLIGQDFYQITYFKYFANMIMLPNILKQGFIDGSYWSLYYEIQFYVFISIIILLNKIDRIKNIFFVWFIVSAAIEIMLEIFGFNFKPLFWIRTLLMTDFSFYFIAGAMSYQIYKKGYAADLMLLFVATLPFAILKEVKHAQHLSIAYGVDISPFVSSILVFFVYVMFFGVSLKKFSLSGNKKIILLGSLTYPLYLIHQVVGFVQINFLSHYMNQFLAISIVILEMILIAYIVSKFIEPKISGMIKKLSAS